MVNYLSYLILCFMLGLVSADYFYYGQRQHNQVITAIKDNGCSNPSKIEIEAPKVYSIWPNINYEVIHEQ